MQQSTAQLALAHAAVGILDILLAAHSGPPDRLDTVGETDQALPAWLAALARKLGVSEEDLDDYVHDLASRPASTINNSGLDGQIAYLIAQAGPAAAEQMIRDAAADRGTGGS